MARPKVVSRQSRVSATLRAREEFAFCAFNVQHAYGPAALERRPMYRIDVLVQGYPGKAVCHGGLGWSTITLLRSQQHTMLIDVGSFGIRKHLAKQLGALGVRPSDVTDVVLTHAHYDHSVNFVLFDRARVWIGADEMHWAAAQPPGFDPLPELYVDALDADPRVRRVAAGDEFLPGMHAIAAPGHTRGS